MKHMLTIIMEGCEAGIEEIRCIKQAHSSGCIYTYIQQVAPIKFALHGVVSL